MVRKIIMFVIPVVFFGMLPFDKVQAQNSPSDKQVFPMLKRFYTSYILALNSVPGSEKKLDSILTAYCDGRLLKKIKQRTEAGDLDYDPFLKAQDVDTACLKTFVFGKDPKRTDAYRFSYVANQGKYKPVIHLIVNQVDGIIRIRNVW